MTLIPLSWFKDLPVKAAHLAITVAGAAIPIFLSIWLVFVSVRPYFVTEMDSEQDYYYNAQLILKDGHPQGIHHPGTPVYYLGALLLRITGPDMLLSQKFFNVAHLASSILVALSIIVLCRIVLPTGSSLALVLVLATLLAWPPFLAYSDFFGADAFIYPPGLILMGLFWMILRTREKKPISWSAALGAAAGGCLAVKLTFVPLIISVFAAHAIHNALSLPRVVGKMNRIRIVLGHSSILLFSSVVTFAAFTFPILDRVDSVWAQLLFRPDARPSVGDASGGILTVMERLAQSNPGVFISILISFLVLVAIWTVAAKDAYRAFRSPSHRQSLDHDSQPDWLGIGVFGGLNLLAFLYTCSASAAITPGAELGIQLRNMTPTFIGLPFLFLAAGYALSISLSKNAGATRWVTGGVIIFATGMIVLGYSQYLTHRAERIAAHQSRIDVIADSVDLLTRPGERIAFWTESHQDYLGPISFHWWGNYRYARGSFSETIAEVYPGFAFFSIRNVWRRARQSSMNPVHQAPSRWGWIGEQWRDMERRMVSNYFYESDLIILPASLQETGVASLIFPTEEYDELRKIGREDFNRWVEETLGASVQRSFRAMDVEWQVFKFH